jgi:hypothetical protein
VTCGLCFLYCYRFEYIWFIFVVEGGLDRVCDPFDSYLFGGATDRVCDPFNPYLLGGRTDSMWIIHTLRRITLHVYWQWYVPWAFTFKNSAFCPYSVQLCIVCPQNSWLIPQRVLILVGCDAVSLVHWYWSSPLLHSAHLKMKELQSFETSGTAYQLTASHLRTTDSITSPLWKSQNASGWSLSHALTMFSFCEAGTKCLMLFIWTLASKNNKECQ